MMPKKINYACGHNIINRDDWINVDNIFSGSYPFGFLQHLNKVYNCDLLRRHPFEDNWFTDAICEDFVEHLTERQAIYFFTEVHRTLIPDGTFTVSSPAWDKIMSVINRNKKFKCGVLKNDLTSPIDRLKELYDAWEHVNFWTKEQLVGFMQLIGMEWIDINSAHTQYFGRNDSQQDINFVMTFKKL